MKSAPRQGPGAESYATMGFRETREPLPQSCPSDLGQPVSGGSESSKLSRVVLSRNPTAIRARNPRAGGHGSDKLAIASLGQ